MTRPASLGLERPCREAFLYLLLANQNPSWLTRRTSLCFGYQPTPSLNGPFMSAKLRSPSCLPGNLSARILSTQLVGRSQLGHAMLAPSPPSEEVLALSLAGRLIQSSTTTPSP